MTGSTTWADGNELAGPLAEVFRMDVSGASGQCGDCGAVMALAQTRLFDHAPGWVARCPACEQVVLRVVRGPGRAWLDLRGLRYLQLPMPNDA